MRNTILKIYVNAQTLWSTLKEDHGQDLVEYAAVIALVVLALTGGMNTLATGINGAMTGLSAKISKALS
jgi:Flp pilus assembly pilin Flp